MLYSLIALVPAVFHPDFYSVFGTPKLLVLRLITLAVLLLWGLKIFLEKQFSYRKSWFNFAVFAYAVVCFATTFTSIAFYTSLYGAHGRFLGLVTMLNLLLIPLLVWNFLKDREKIRDLLITGFVVSGILAVYGIFQHFGVWQEQFNWNQDPADRVFGTLGHGNHFGAYLGMNFVLGIFLVKEIKRSWLKILFYAGLAAQTVTIFLTASRGAILAVLLALGLCGLAVLFMKSKTEGFKPLKWLVPGFVIMGVIIGGAVVFKDELVKVPLIERTAITVESIGQGKIPDRYSWWLSAAEMTKDKPFLGYGLSVFRDIYNEYRRLDYETVEEGDQEAHITPEAAHNEYLNIAATQGLIGLFLWIAMVFVVFSKTNDRLFGENENGDYYALLGLKGALTVYLVQVFFSFGVISTLTVFYVYLGAALALSVPEVKERVFKWMPFKYTVSLVLIVLAAVGLNFTLREAGADYYYKAALSESARANLEGALDNFVGAISLMPDEYAYRQALGDYALQAAQTADADVTRLDLLLKAVASYDDAVKINPHHPSVYFNKGVAKLQLYSLTEERNYYKEAFESMETSIEKSPNNPLYPYQVAKAFMTIDDDPSHANAIRFLLDALDIRENYRDANELLEQLTGKSNLHSTPQSDYNPETAGDAVLPAE